MAQLPSGPEFGIPFYLTGPDGGRAAFNDPNDLDYVGVITDMTGLDSAEVRENADDLVQLDGGIHGDFFYGRRPITITGNVLITDTIDRNTKMTKLQRATNALRGDASLTWTPDGGVQQFINVRRQQPLRITGGWVKTFQVALVAADPRIYASTPKSQTVLAGTVGFGGFKFPITFPLSFGPAVVTNQLFCENQGNGNSFPVLTVTGPCTNPVITNYTTGQSIGVIYSLNAGETLVIDTLNRTVLFVGVTPVYRALDFVNTSWWALGPGVSDTRFAPANFGVGASLRVDWRDAWI